ncbi:MAG: aryl-sulfate sulfotransferase [Haloarculaceae archaeon]
MVSRRSLPARRWLARGVVALTVALLVGAATVATATADRRTAGPGTVRQNATGETVVSVQGFHFEGVANPKKPARVVGAAPNATTAWTYDGASRGAVWFYDVDPLPDGHLLVTQTVPGDTLVYELDPESGRRVWQQRLDAEDTHDVDLINGDELLVANMRNYDPGDGVNHDRLYVYNLTTDRITWQWQFHDHFPASGGGDYRDDWTHVNDVDKIADGEFLVSVRNFDQVIVVNRSSKRIDMRLGRDGDHSILYEQHNPDYLVSDAGNPTMLVADSENDRVVEYARENGTWNRTWQLTGNLNWPRDADRLPNGNTLITDTLNQRVIEVTPRGRVVWEYYAAWAPYDAERRWYGGGSRGPTMADANVTGSYRVHGGAGEGPIAHETVGGWLQRTGLEWLGARYSHVVPFVRPVWIPSWAFAGYLLAALSLVGWGLLELAVNRRRVVAALARLRERVRTTG